MGRIDERIQIIHSGEPAFPALLKEIKDPPRALYCVGEKKLLNSRCVAVVGSRTTTAYGRNTARALGGCLAEHGVTVVSGMASGIDTCAHEGVLRRGGKTIAVLGCGVDVCYPPGNEGLKADIEERGLVVSEYPPGTRPMARLFPHRNRIISGLSELVVVVQARVRSGALITAERAAEQGRDLFAVPGAIDSQYHLGTNQLIRDGAGVLTTVEEVLEPLGLHGGGRQDAAKRLSKGEFQIYQMLEERGEMSADELCIHLSCTPSYLLPMLTAMELKGFICSEVGKFFLANP